MWCLWCWRIWGRLWGRFFDDWERLVVYLYKYYCVKRWWVFFCFWLVLVVFVWCSGMFFLWWWDGWFKFWVGWECWSYIWVCWWLWFLLIGIFWGFLCLIWYWGLLLGLFFELFVNGCWIDVVMVLLWDCGRLFCCVDDGGVVFLKDWLWVFVWLNLIWGCWSWCGGFLCERKWFVVY